MPQFSRRTILEVRDIIAGWTHADIDRLVLRQELEQAMVGGSCAAKANAIGRYLIANPEAENEDGGNVTDAVVTEVVQDTVRMFRTGYPPTFQYENFRDSHEPLQRALARDGFTVEGGQLRRALPEALDLPAADDEVRVLLLQYNFEVPTGHLDQGITAHGRGDWAAANAQFRAFIESLYNSISAHLAAGEALPVEGYQRQIWLANRNPPFFYQDLNEWDGQGHGFIQAFFRRLHPAGAHPGLSDEEDSTFRLHLVLLVSRNLLRRM